jgi:hypothetical protein
MSKYTLHKLQQGFVITSDEETKRGRFYCFRTKSFFDDDGQDVNCCMGDVKVIAQQDQIDFSALSEEEQKKIEWFDVDKLFDNIFPNKHLLESHDYHNLKDGFTEGFQKAQELLSDRRFTLVDMLEFYYWLKKSYGPTKPLEEAQIVHRTTPDKIVEMFAQSLSQPKSFSIELEMGEYRLNSDGEPIGFPDMSKPKLTDGKVKILKLL